MNTRSILFQAVLIAILSAAIIWTINLTYRTGYDAGAQAASVKASREKATLATQHNLQLQAQTRRANTLQDRLETQAALAHKEQTHAQAENNRLRAALRTGAVRLSILTRSPTCPASIGDQHPGPAPGPDPARTELDPATSEALVTITHDGDNAIRDLNTCISRYNTVRQALNAPAPQE
ncbi:MAG: lysis protein [Burkholderiales bacterium]|nr:lysis protein [Burkholderiales bacterium]